MSDLPKCKLCGADAAMHKVFGGIKYCCSSETCTIHDVLMLKSQWRTLMTQQQAEPSQVPTGHVFLPEITPEMWETLGDTDVMTWIDGPQWTQIAVDFASMLPVKMPAQQPDQDRLRFQSACEISGDKHPEYVRGYEAAMDAVCKAQRFTATDEAQPAPIPTSWQPIETAPIDVLHVRGLWVYDDSGQPLSFDCDTGRIDDDGFFVDEFGNPHGWSAGDYTHWHPLAIPPAPGGSDE